ncbi:BA14K family protein [Rhodobacteraceae bacterium RKSG542]|nr:BA14K family protein [Pseudovibrio flavus]
MLVPVAGVGQSYAQSQTVIVNKNVVVNGGRHKGGHHRKKHWKRHKHKKGIGAGEAFALGAIGFIAGAMIASSAQSNAYTPPPPAYAPPQPYPYPYQSQTTYNGYGAPQPWSPQWYQYCSSKYRSFNPSTGTYTTYSGVQRMCQ